MPEPTREITAERDALRAEVERAEDESAKLRRQIIDERVQATRTSQELFAKWRGERDQARAERDKERESRIAWALEADGLEQSRDLAHEHRGELLAEVYRLKRALAGHLFDGESLSTRDAIRLELIEQQHKRIHELLAEVARLWEENRELAAALPCGWCKGTGIAPEETFGRDGDGAPMVDGDQPCPEGCRPSVSDQTPATPDDACPKRGDSHCLHYQEGDGACCACKKLPCLCPDVPQDECPRHESAAAPSSVQGDTTPGELTQHLRTEDHDAQTAKEASDRHVSPSPVRAQGDPQ